jgi:hypothetical protein
MLRRRAAYDAEAVEVWWEKDEAHRTLNEKGKQALQSLVEDPSLPSATGGSGMATCAVIWASVPLSPEEREAAACGACVNSPLLAATETARYVSEAGAWQTYGRHRYQHPAAQTLVDQTRASLADIVRDLISWSLRSRTR